jgi:phospholipid/cholesterol/gamma-HCH transport system substrate-binding protein
LPVGRGSGGARAITIVAIALAVVVLAFVLFSGGSAYHVRLMLVNASQLVPGNDVKVGGIPVGSIDSIHLADNGFARVDVSIDDAGVTPLHQGTRATVRSTSLSGVANRYIALTPGPLNMPKLADGREIPVDDTTSEVDLDEVLNTLTPGTLHDLQQLTRNSASAFAGRGNQFGKALADLDPALSQGDALEQEILRDEGRFSRFLVESADVVSTVASRRTDLTELVASTRATLSAIASRNTALDSLLQGLPPTLREGNTTLVNLRSTLRDADPTIRAARPAAPLLRQFFDLLQPVAQRGRPVVPTLRQAIDSPGRGDLLGVLEGFPPLERLAVPAFDSAVATVKSALPIVNELRPYTPDVVGGLQNGFGGSTSGYYDANGHYTRISFQGSTPSLAGTLSLAAQAGLPGYRKNLTHRCPGAATQSAPDHSNPFVIPGTCSAADSPR